MTARVAPNGVHQFFDDNGNPLAGGKVYTYDAGTSTPRLTWADSGEVTPKANPVVLDSAGRATIFWRGVYKVIVKTSADVTVSTVDNFDTTPAAVLTSAEVALALNSFKRTAAEISAAVTPTDYSYPPGDIRRYGAVGDNSTLCQTAIAAAISVCAVSGDEVIIPSGRFKTTASVALLAKVNIRGMGYGSVIEATSCDAFTLGFTTGFGKVTLRDFAINGTSASTNRAIYQAGTLNDADELYGLCFSRLLITNFNVGIKLRNARVVTIENCWIQHVNIALDLTGKCLVFNIRGNEFVYGTGSGSGAKIGVNMDTFNFTSGTGIIGPEGVQIEGNQIYGFDYAVAASYGFFCNIDGNDIVAKVQGIQYQTVQYVFNIRRNYIEMQGAAATQAIIGLGLGSTISTQVNIEGNGIDGSTLSTCSGIQVNESGNQNQNHTRIVGNRIKNMPTSDIWLYAAGHATVEDNNCESSAPTNSIRVDSVVTGIVHVDKNKCAKAIYFDPAEAATGEVRLGVNWVSGTTRQHGAQICPVVASAAALTLPLGADVFLISGTTSITSIVATGWTGRTVRLIFQGALTLTDGSNLKLAGNFVSTADDAIQLCCDGTNWYTCGGPSAN